jgi:CBS domain-containing protein
MRVKDLRTGAVVTIEPEASVVEACRLMQEKRIRHLPSSTLVGTSLEW